MNDRIVSRAQELGLKQKDIVNRISASKGTVSKWFNGTAKPSGDHLVQLAKVLGTSTEWLSIGNLKHKILKEEEAYGNRYTNIYALSSDSQKALMDEIQQMIEEGKLTDQVAEAVRVILQSVQSNKKQTGLFKR